jgi:hypothetical protein
VTSRRAAGPGPRTVAPKTPLLPAVLVLLCVTAVAACSAAPGPNLTPVSIGPGGSPAARTSAAPDDSGPRGSIDPSARPRWPGTTVLAVIALGAADGEIRKAGDDLQRAADAEDLKAMWGAADGLAKMIEGLMPNIDRLEIYDGTRAVAALYRKAFPELDAGARQLRDSITKGDSAGVVAGSQLIAQGLQDYAPIRPLIADLVEEAIVQQRLLLQ